MLGNEQLGTIVLGQDNSSVVYNASNVISFSQSAVATHVGTKSASNTLAFSQSATFTVGNLNRSINQPIVFTQIARGFNGNKKIIQPIVFSQVAAVIRTYVRSVASTINILQAASVDLINTTSNVITFTSTASAERYKGANNALTFVQTVTSSYSPHNEYLIQVFNITQSASVGKVNSVVASSPVSFTQVASGGRVKTVSASNFVLFHSNTTSTKIGIIHQTFVINQAVTQFRIISKTAKNTLSFHDQLNRNVTYNLHASNNFVFTSTHLKNGISIPNVIVTIPRDYVIYQVPGQAVKFKPPLFGDTEAGKGKLIEERTTAGGLFTYVRRSLSRKLVYKFDISYWKAEEFRKYIKTNLSNPMYLTNWKGELWYGHIVTNPFVTTSRGRSVPFDHESFEITVEFEGTRLH